MISALARVTESKKRRSLNQVLDQEFDWNKEQAMNGVTQSLLDRYRRGDRNFRGENFVGADLSGLNLKGADFTAASLRSANLARSHLEGANFQRGILQGTDLSFAKLNGASFVNTDLTKAQLTGAILIDADLTHARLSGDGLGSGCIFPGQAAKAAQIRDP